MIRRGLAAGVLVIAAWVTLPLWQQEAGLPLAKGMPGSTASLPPATELRGPAPAPIRYAYQPECPDQSGPCLQWHLVSTRGEQWWLPGASAQDTFVLSDDGTRATYPRGKGLVLHDLMTGEVTPLSVKGEEPIFSLDGRHLAAGREVADLATGRVHRLNGVARAWTSRGVITSTLKPDDHTPGQVNVTFFTVSSPEGKRLSRFTAPGDLSSDGVLSPSGRQFATLTREVTPTSVTTTSILISRERAVTPRLPAGWTITTILRWTGEDTLLVRLRGPVNRVAYTVVDLTTGRPLPGGVEERGLSTVIGRLD
ncbi:hypothetical protein [Nonomuraea endophytica]|uniref:Uncharacterized protein n=1 Tax=Nonomuraea endophytica TaxID=714136 RepID=A0A7W7ZW87_9ACTN|nr:hypothetical protein [Nonomuraea endophytica]MBB5074939.1 hypothetical protein [Nonomuraea endophytica]